jgi:hypothetical protein
MRRVDTRTLLTMTLGLVLLAGGLVLGSNMAFRYKASFQVPDRDYWLSLPYHNEYTEAQDICRTIGPGASLVSRFDTQKQVRQDWTCPWGRNFDLTPGEGLFVRVSDPASPIFTGHHDPNLRIPVSGFVHPGRDYYLSLPYSTRAEVANDLCQEVPYAVLVTRFDSQSGIAHSWTCPWGNNFSIETGEAFRIRVNKPSGGFIPAHY